MNDRGPHITYFGDAEHLHVRRWVGAMVSRGCRVSFITEQKVSLPGVEIRSPQVSVPVKGIGLGRLLQSRKIRQILKDLNPDIVHGHFIHDTGYVAARTGFHPLAITVWGSDVLVVPGCSRAGEKKAIFTLRRADLVTADSKELLRAAVRLGAEPRTAHLVNWGVDTKEYAPEPHARSLRAELGLPLDSLLFLSNRRLRPLYRIADIIRAFADALPSIEDAYLLVVGAGDDRESLTQTAAESGVSDRVIFLGPVDHMSPFVRAADVFVSVPESDATAVSLLEAMACAKPVIVSDLESNREWVTEGENGWIVRVGDVPSIARAMHEAAEDEGRRRRYGNTSRSLVLERGNAEIEMDRVLQLYLGLLGRQT